MQKRSGFTLIELLLVIVIMGVLGSIIFLALNPQRQLGLARDRKRFNDITSILDAVYQYQVDENQLPPGIPLTLQEICKKEALSCNNGVDINILTASGKYLVTIPHDPHAPESGTGTAYFIVKDANKRITLTAPLAEQTESGTVMSVTR